ncbi:MAG: SDR family oxidoreductase [Deltaproteobacteria bacterium]|nr:SDR family oxidoreductase [Deltaproteobacteria bacterium]
MAEHGDRRWALILGASSGFGEATALELARRGFDICGVHLDRRAGMAHVEEITRAIRAEDRDALFFNVNAADHDKRCHVLDALAARIAEDGGGSVHVLMHSLAFGSLSPLIGGGDGTRFATAAQLTMTLEVMAQSLVYWVQDALARGLLVRGSRVLAMTSAGASRVWPNYGVVSAAKAALESYVRQLAVELGTTGVTVNAIRAGVTDTPALRKIPGGEWMTQQAAARNPSGRLTATTDVAQVIAMLAGPESQWITGTVIGVDGGEDLVA